MPQKLQSLLENGFEAYGRGVARNPWPIVIVGVLLNTAFGVCLLSLQLNNNILSLYIPRNTETEKHTQEVLSHFPDTSSSRFHPSSSVKRPIYAEVIVASHDSGNILSSNYSGDTNTIVDYIRNISFTASYQRTLTYNEVCAKAESHCIVSGLSLIGQDTLMNATMEESEFIGDKTVINGSIIGARYLKLRFYLRQGNSDETHDSKTWLKEFRQKMKKFHSENIKVVYSHCYSFFEELDNDTYADIPYFSLAALIIIFYYNVLASGGDCVSKRVNIARIGIIVTPLSVMGAWGFLSGCGLTFTNIIGAMPYVLLYHQMNNMMLTFSALSDNLDQSSAADRVGIALRRSMIPVTLVTFAHVCAFISLIWSHYLAMEIVALYTVATIVFNYLNHMTFFAAALAIHERGIDASHHCCTCNTVMSPDHPEAEGRSGCFKCCCTGRQPTTRAQVESILEKVPRYILSKFILSLPVKVFLFFILLGGTGLGIWRLQFVNDFMFQETSVTKASYFSSFYDIDEKYFRRDYTVTFTILNPVSFTAENNLDMFLNYFQSIPENTDLYSGQTTCWLLDYVHSTWVNTTSDTNFIDSLRENFLPNQEKFIPDIQFRKDNMTIEAFRCYLNFFGSPSLKSLMAVKETFNDYGEIHGFGEVDVVVHCPEFMFIDSYKEPLYNVLRFAGVHAGVLALTFFLVHVSLYSSFQIIIWCGLFSVWQFGCLTYFEIPITSVALIFIILGECFGAEVIIHSYCSYMQSLGLNRSAKMYNVLSTTTPFLFNTTLGAFLGMLALFVEKSYVFIAVFKIFAVSSVIACLFGSLFIPAVLSIFGAEIDQNLPDSKELVISTIALQEKSHPIPLNISKSLHQKENGHPKRQNENGPANHQKENEHAKYGKERGHTNHQKDKGHANYKKENGHANESYITEQETVNTKL